MDNIDRASELEIQQRERALEAKKQAMQSKAGSSHCFDCDSPIPALRRKAVPGAIRCVECQQIHEIWGRR